MGRLISLDGARGEGGGQVLRTALALSAVTKQGFEITRIRAGRSRSGLRPQHLVAVRAAAMACDARLGGVFEGSPDLRFEPGDLRSGQFRFEIATAGATTLVLQTIVPPLGLAGEASRVEVTGGTHVPQSPSFDYLSRHWRVMVETVGLQASFTLVRAGFFPKGGGEVRADIQPWQQLRRGDLDRRGALLSVNGVSGDSRLRNDVARRQRDAAQARLWEARRIETEWLLNENVASASPGSFLLLQAVFERSRAAFAFVGERGLRAERLGDRAARQLLRFLETDSAVDPHLADQLVVPFALSGCGGRTTTSEVTEHLLTQVSVLQAFGIGARVWGRRGGPGGVEVDRV